MARLKRSELSAIIAQLAKTSKSQKQLAKSVAGYLVQNHQTPDLDAILRNIMAIREQDGIVEANVTSAFPLSLSVEKEIKQAVHHAYPQAKKVIIDQDVNPDVLSGVKVQTIDKQLDETARGKLQQLTRAVA